VGVLGNDGTLFQFYLFPNTGTPIALNFFKQHCFVVSVPRFFLSLSAPQAEKV